MGMSILILAIVLFIVWKVIGVIAALHDDDCSSSEYIGCYLAEEGITIVLMATAALALTRL